MLSNKATRGQITSDRIEVVGDVVDELLIVLHRVAAPDTSPPLHVTILLEHYMDILTCITAIASCVTALAAAFTVIIAVHQFNVTIEENERTRQREYEQNLEDNASLVDVWIACTKDENSHEHHIVIDNSSEASIRNLQINCTWNNAALKG